jgi:Zn-dependent peptidase ImmA (M78 family)/ribosome-binding protein aMBF1 (putative translation factor)
MIKNEWQYRTTKTQVERFQEALQKLNNSEIAKQIHPSLLKAEKDAIESQVSNLQKELEEYENLRQSKRPPLIELRSVDELPRALIKARISLGLSQRDLAERIGVKEQQVQRWEATEYSTASLARVKELVEVLHDIIVTDKIQLPNENVPLSVFFKRLANAGLEKDFVLRRLLPPSLASQLAEASPNTLPDLLGYQAATHIGRVYGWKAEDLFSPQMPQLEVPTILGVKYKKTKNANESKLNAYTVYAHYVALLVLQATEQLQKKTLPTKPYEIHNSIISDYGSISLENVVRYVWKLGVAVIALSDPGSFHGAWFRDKNNRSIIILKQNTISLAKWMFDLFHELYHATHSTDQTIHFENASSADEDESKANQFAGAVLLGRAPQQLYEKCMEEANFDILRLKSAILKIAQREGVPIDILAYYLAFRLAHEGKGHSVWGIAENLQIKHDKDPRIILRNIFLEHANLSVLAQPDLEILRQALTPLEMTING